jgi:hypothetical protein
MNRHQAYKEAVAFMEASVDAMDQAVAYMKDARVEARAGGFRRPSHRELLIDAESILKDLRDAECEDCGRKISTDCKCSWLHSEVL